MEIICVSGDGPTFRNVIISFVFGGSDDFGFAEILGFFGGLLSPNAGLEIGGFGFHQVGGHHEELGAGTAAEEEDLVIVGDVEQIAPKLAGFCHKTFPTRGAVGNLHQADAGVVEIADSNEIDNFFSEKRSQRTPFSEKTATFCNVFPMSITKSIIPILSCISNTSQEA